MHDVIFFLLSELPLPPNDGGFTDLLTMNVSFRLKYHVMREKKVGLFVLRDKEGREGELLPRGIIS